MSERVKEVINFYTKEYNEEQRLEDGCDNRHAVERVVKQRIYRRFIKDGMRVLEIGAGTGVHTIELARRGVEMSACDLVEEHVSLIKKKANDYNLRIDVVVADALKLPYNDGEFDCVLLAGPIYHLKNDKDKLKAVKEAARVCKKCGYVLVDYLPKVHGFIQHCLLSRSFIQDRKQEELSEMTVQDPIFSYNSSGEMVKMISLAGLSLVQLMGTDGITRFIRDEINSYEAKELRNWIDFIDSTSADESTVGLSEHAIAIGYKLLG